VKLHNSAGCVTNIVYSGASFSQNIGLTWNSQYQLVAVATNGVECERNGFDAVGRRVWNWDGTRTNYMIYDGVHVLAEVDSTGGLRRAYTHGPGVDNWLAMTVYTGATTKTYFYLTDIQGSVMAVVDETASVVESYRYDAWGRVLGVYDGNNNPLTQSAIGNKILWQGREYSWNTGLYYFRYRFYDPITGRWLSNDPIGISGGLNQYAFCESNPLNFRDPRGLSGWLAITAQDSGTTYGSRTGSHAWITFVPDNHSTFQDHVVTAGSWNGLGVVVNGKNDFRYELRYLLGEGGTYQRRYKYIDDYQEAALKKALDRKVAEGGKGWGYFSPCSAAAADLWCAVTGEDLDDRGFLGISTPATLADSIRAQGGISSGGPGVSERSSR
jgi:RHS repeat-associated protein